MNTSKVQQFAAEGKEVFVGLEDSKKAWKTATAERMCTGPCLTSGKGRQHHTRSRSKAKQRLVREMLYNGIQAGKDIKLSCITRALNESIPLLTTKDRPSRNLDDCDSTDTINNEIVRLGSRKVLDDMVIAIDPGDIRKKYASRMEYLCKVHDGSEHEVGDDGQGCCRRYRA
jgi:hypothetical protein